ncbi:MAG TPA: NAD(+)/NADH kinase [Gaiellaceae bacterium]|nr:NAD(+)/NADH kinase [Gaiellaceae bacterium]
MQRSAEPARRIAVVSHGDPERVREAISRLEAVASSAGVEIVDGDDVDLAVVLGGDGTMLRALHRFLGTDVPVIGVNFGRVGFLSAMPPQGLEDGLVRAFAGERRIVELPTLEVDVDGVAGVGVNDVVCASGAVGRMVELSWAVGGEDLGIQPCDGIICATATGSTAYNLSAGGPVLVWGLDAMAATFVSPHSLHARPLVVPRGLDLTIRNETRGASANVTADGLEVGELAPGREALIRLGERRALLALLPEMTFFRRYRETFAS